MSNSRNGNDRTHFADLSLCAWPRLSRWLLAAAMFWGVVLLSGCEKARLDEQVRELCAKDGGIKVYEVVKLPAQEFDQWGVIKFYRPTQGENALGPDYLFQHDTVFYKRGNPQMYRSHFRILRRADRKLLGETVVYGRGGGDFPLPLPMHGSSFHCPDPNVAGEVQLLKQIFMKS